MKDTKEKILSCLGKGEQNSKTTREITEELGVSHALIYHVLTQLYLERKIKRSDKVISEEAGRTKGRYRWYL